MTRKTISAANPSIFDYQHWVEKMAANATALDRLLTVVDFKRFCTCAVRARKKQTAMFQLTPICELLGFSHASAGA